MELTNARAGAALYLRKFDTSKELEQVVLWKDQVSASLFAGVLTITPDFNVLFTEFFMVTDCMFLDIYRDYLFNSPTITKLVGTPSPSEAKFFVLPREVRYDLPHYRVRPEPEEVEGHPCHVLEYPDKDLIWVDPACNFALRKRCNFQAPGHPLYIVENTGLTERSPGVWIPSKTSKTVYHTIYDPKLKGKIHATEVNVVKSCKINELTPDSFLPLPIKEGYFVDDQIRGVSYRVLDEGPSSFDEAVESVKEGNKFGIWTSRLNYYYVIAIPLIAVNALFILNRLTGHNQPSVG